MSVIRNMYTKRVKLTVTTFMSTDKFGLRKFSREEKYNALVALAEKGIDRCNNTHLLTLPIFHAFSIKKEITENKKEAKQENLLSRQIKSKDYREVNGKRIEDILWASDVAMIITIIMNHLVCYIVGIFIVLSFFINIALTLIFLFYIITHRISMMIIQHMNGLEQKTNGLQLQKEDGIQKVSIILIRW